MVEFNKDANAQITPKEIVDASIGKDLNGEPNCGISVSEQIIDEADRIKALKESVFTTPSINLVLNGDFIILDVIFPSASDTEMRVLWNILTKFGKTQTENCGSVKTPILQFVVLPLSLSGEYYYTLLNPVFWALQPSIPGVPTDSIRLLFEKEALSIFKAAPVSEKEIDAEVSREEYEKNRISEAEMRKNAEHEEYLEKMNKRFNPREY